MHPCFSQVLNHTVAMRQTHATDMNDRSSRSHAIFTLYITIEDRDSFAAASGDDETRGEGSVSPPPPSSPANGGNLGNNNNNSGGRLPRQRKSRRSRSSFSNSFQQCTRLNFVDLSGSENAKKSGSTGDRAREAMFINQGTSVRTVRAYVRPGFSRRSVRSVIGSARLAGWLPACLPACLPASVADQCVGSRWFGARMYV